MEPPAQPELGSPGPRDDAGIETLLAPAQGGAERWMGLVGPGGLDELGAKVGVAGMGDPPRQVR